MLGHLEHTVFYDSLIDIESLRDRLPVGNASQFREVRKRAFSILDKAIMAAIFERLPKEYHEEFVDRLAVDREDPALAAYLIQRIGPLIQDDVRAEFHSTMLKLTPLLARIVEEPS
jgi:hypothetical protein